jgi:hypothetical protein
MAASPSGAPFEKRRQKQTASTLSLRGMSVSKKEKGKKHTDFDGRKVKGVSAITVVYRGSKISSRLRSGLQFAFNIVSTLANPVRF